MYVPAHYHQDFHTRIIFVYPSKSDHKKEDSKKEEHQKDYSHFEDWDTWNYESKHKSNEKHNKEDYPKYEDVRATEEYLNREREKNPDNETDTYQPFDPAFGPIVMDHPSDAKNNNHYDVIETLDETPHNEVDSYKQNNHYQKGYTKGNSVQTGHNYSSEENKYYDDKEDEDESNNASGESHDTYQAYSGRYLVDEEQSSKQPNSKELKRRMLKTRRIRFYH